ncbi:fimbrial protein [Tatumella sp. JGM118]|uniref:fimbrial protein n=1 Tax=Tatumella sp. JGM118 TaxID=2799796 RepID=UPI001BB01AB4|nr:fimbrial protein [Tatumella sp. JGM118]MBS0909439.1 fimbrial protein [Tatumella sp. JGM118]
MKLKDKILPTFILCLSVYSVPSMSGDIGTVNIEWTANIITWGCTVSSASSDMTVPLGTWSTRNFSSGDYTTPVGFTISLSGCNSNTVAATFTGTSDSTNSNYLALSSTSTSTNVAIEIKDSTKKLLPLNTISSANAVDSSGNVTMNFFANYIGTGSNVTAGTANADATFTLTYE